MAVAIDPVRTLEELPAVVVAIDPLKNCAELLACAEASNPDRLSWNSRNDMQYISLLTAMNYLIAA